MAEGDGRADDVAPVLVAHAVDDGLGHQRGFARRIEADLLGDLVSGGGPPPST
ncbi:hypothetical protein ABZY30_29375 [Streptomyces massasporeus]|uniref:hypothetical protein n=1 Tax=Streptomyces massasporeus TaxID=67324 RepID=UPI0033A9CDC1